MTVEILGTESLGVRGMSCLVTAGKRRILIDPGIALGYQRHGFLPHPCQVAAGVKIRQSILQAMESATDVVFSHFHGDHVPLLRANPYQLSFRQLPSRFSDLHCWSLYSSGCETLEDLSPHMQSRVGDLVQLLGPNMRTAAGCSDGPLRFSGPVPHGRRGSRFGSVMMTRVEMEGQVFVHASDIQLLDEMTTEKIILWNPDIVFAAGPPLYLQALSGPLRGKAWENGLRLARNVETLVVDHHLLRSVEGLVVTHHIIPPSPCHIVYRDRTEPPTHHSLDFTPPVPRTSPRHPPNCQTLLIDFAGSEQTGGQSVT